MKNETVLCSLQISDNSSFAEIVTLEMGELSLSHFDRINNLIKHLSEKNPQYLFTVFCCSTFK